MVAFSWHGRTGTELVGCVPQVSELEAMRKREEGNLKALQKEHQQLKKEQFKAAQALHSLRQVRHCERGLAHGMRAFESPCMLHRCCRSCFPKCSWHHQLRSWYTS